MEKTLFNERNIPLIEVFCEVCKVKHAFISPSSQRDLDKAGFAIYCLECGKEVGLHNQAAARSQYVKLYKMKVKQ